MTDLFFRVLENSLSACWLIAAVLLVRLLFKGAPKKLFPLLWSMVGLRLILPLKLLSPFSLVPPAEMARGATALPALQMIQTLWLPGFLGLLALGLVSYFRLRRKLDTAVCCGQDFWKSERVTVPFVLGSFRPRIYLPFGLMPEDEANILRHERAHIRRGDHWIKPLAFFVLAMNWFNPLIWTSYWLLTGDMELACDELAAGSLDRASYSQTLLKCSLSETSIWVCPLAFGTRRLKKRIRLVTEGRKYTRPVRFASLMIILAFSLCFLTDPPAGEKTTDREQTTARNMPARREEATEPLTESRPKEALASYSPQKEEKKLRREGKSTEEPAAPALWEEAGEEQETSSSYVVLCLSQKPLYLMALQEAESHILAAGEGSADVPAHFCIVVPEMNWEQESFPKP